MKNNMRIIIDARLYGTRHRGIGRYVEQLIYHLALVDKNNHYILLVNPANPESPCPADRRELLAAPWPPYSLGEQIHLPRLVNKISADIIHFPHFNIPLWRLNKPVIVTIHDLIINHFPSSRATTLPQPLYQLKLMVYRQVIKQAIKRAEQIITVSEATKRDIIQAYPGSGGKTTVIYPGLSQWSGTPANLNLPEYYFLVVGAAYPHKNLEILLQSFKVACAALPNYVLIIVGRKDFFMRRLQQTAAGLTLTNKVIFWGEASDSALATLYQKAKGYILPSLIEGFGFGPLEALAHATPVAVSDIPVLREVLGNQAIYFNPYSMAELSKALTQLSHAAPPNPIAITALGERFNWLKTATTTLAIYQKVYQKVKPPL